MLQSAVEPTGFLNRIIPSDGRSVLILAPLSRTGSLNRIAVPTSRRSAHACLSSGDVSADRKRDPSRIVGMGLLEPGGCRVMLVGVLGGVVVGVGEPVCGSAEGLDEVVDAFEGSVGVSVVVPGEDLG